MRVRSSIAVALVMVAVTAAACSSGDDDSDARESGVVTAQAADQSADPPTTVGEPVTATAAPTEARADGSAPDLTDEGAQSELFNSLKETLRHIANKEWTDVWSAQTAECRDQTTVIEVAAAMGLATAFLGEDFLKQIVNAELADFRLISQDGPRATVAFAVVSDGVPLIDADEETIVLWEDGEWHDVECVSFDGSVGDDSVSPNGPLESEPPTSRENLLPMGTSARIAGWTITVLSVIEDATDEVFAENQFNDPPADGKQFFIVRIEATYEGEGSSTLFFDVDFSALGPSSVAYDIFSDGCGVIPEALNDVREVFTGGTISGNVCWQVLTADAGELVMFGDESFSFNDDRTWWSLH